MSDAITANYAEQIAQLTKDRDELQTQLDAWHSAFGTSQLTHATAFYDVAKRSLEHSERERDTFKARADQAEAKVKRLREALKVLYDETADYIRVNHLGGTHHNRSMQIAKQALAETEAK